MTTAYREQGRTVDETEVEINRIKETEITKRKTLELRAAARADRRAKFATFFSYDGTMFILLFSVLTILGTLATVAIMYAEATFRK